MSPRFNNLKHQHPPHPIISWWLGVIVLGFLILAALTFCTPSHAEPGCARMLAYAQASANEMAARDSMGNHDYFRRQPHVGGENIGWGYKTEAAMIDAWWRSPGHATNMRLRYRCKVTAHARSLSGKVYWAMEVGD